jgi:hypothetical protein
VKSPIVGGQLPLLDIEGLKPEGKEPYAIEIKEVPDHRRRGATDLADVEYLLKHNSNTARALTGDNIYGAGDFRSRECVKLLKQADIVVTNPPFSLFREFVAQLVAYDKRQEILDYELSVYVCEGADSEKLDWFKIINIAGERLTDQELRNAIYTGTWLADAKRWFSKTGAPAVQEGRDKLVSGLTLRQEVLETALYWISGGKIEDYMSAHQHDKDAQELWQYWQAVFDWVKRVFPNQDSARAKLMKALPWGKFYNEHKDDKLNAAELEQRIVKLIDDDEVNSKKGIYEYLLTGNERTLSLRAFDEKTKQQIYAKQNGICPTCKKSFTIGEMEADHILPWTGGGKTTPENCQMLCKLDNRTKSGK